MVIKNYKSKDIVKQNRKRFPTGVVHSFTGDLKDLNLILELDLYIGEYRIMFFKLIKIFFKELMDAPSKLKKM